MSIAKEWGYVMMLSVCMVAAVIMSSATIV